MAPPKEPEQTPLDDGEALYQAAIAAELDAQLNAEMAEWETATLSDSLECDRLRLTQPQT